MFLFFPLPALTRTVLIALITLLTLLGIMLRPWKVSEAITALSGAGLILILGLLSPKDALVTSQFPPGLLTFLRLLFLPSLLVIAMNAGVFYMLYRRQLHGRFDIKRLPALQETVKHHAYFRYTCVILIVVAAAYIIAAAFQFPLSLVAIGGAILLLCGGLYWKQTTLSRTAGQVSWPIFGFIAGMFLVVQALETTGLTAQFGQLLLRLCGGTSFGAVMVGTLGSALGTNLINNVPMAVVMTSALRGIQHAPLTLQQGFVVATIFGCDLGPNLTTVGSLATVLWLLILRQRNIEVSGLDYFKVGTLVTPLMLIAGAIAIWLLLI
jgi:arsenical pump membrane protein